MVEGVGWMVDGDGNGEINLADLTVIGLNFGNEVPGYTLYASPDGQGYPAKGSARHVADVEFSHGSGSSADRKPNAAQHRIRAGTVYR